jgi:2-polyprenyl-3-methyl-5-hydroxy-6-metoxy-1,4-benzoquinol methylase
MIAAEIGESTRRPVNERALRQTAADINKLEDASMLAGQVCAESTAGNTCLLCAGASDVVLIGMIDNRLGTPGSYDIRRCVRCGFEQTSPLPSQAELKELYEKYYNFGGESGTCYTKWRERFLFSSLYRLWTQLDGDVAFHGRRGSGRLLDIGCNEGRGLRTYATNGFQAEGLELNENAAAMARAGGFKVYTCLLEEFDLDASYDVAVVSNVLEHSLNPRQMLRDINRVLKTNGEVWISCPNGDSWLRRAFGRSWINWHVPFHISHFSESTLRQLLKETGYSRVQIRQITPALWVAQSVITRIFAEKGRKTGRLRSAFWTLLLMMFARFVLFPALWLGNQSGHGDCLLAVASKT